MGLEEQEEEEQAPKPMAQEPHDDGCNKAEADSIM